MITTGAFPNLSPLTMQKYEDLTPILILTNSDSSAEAELIADQLLDQRLAAAVQIIGPLSSRYRWQDQIHKKQEWMILIKTIARREEKITATIKELHSYELPSIMTVSIEGGESQYLEWILSQSRSDNFNC